MVIDLLSPSNIGTYNIKAAQILGLSASVYLNELISIYYKAISKNKLDDKGYFKLQRDYITNRTTLTQAQQLEIDNNLANIKILSMGETKDYLKLDLDMYASILTNQDIKSLNKVRELASKKSREEKKEDKLSFIISNLQKYIQCPNTESELRNAYFGWIESLVRNPRYGGLDKQKVALFEEDINKIAKGNLDLALNIIKEATKCSYINAQWAYNNLSRNKNSLRTSQTHNIITNAELSKEAF